MKIHVLSRLNMKKVLELSNLNNNNIHEYNTAFFILINNTDESSLLKDNVNVKSFYFDDVSNNEVIPKLEISETGKINVISDGYNLNAFTINQADDMCQYILNNIDKDYCYIHCSAGINRSGSIGSFICDITKSNYEDFKRINPRIQGNPLVSQLLREAYNKHFN